MTEPDGNAQDATGPTWAGCRRGVVATFALLPGIALFAMAFGALAAQKGLGAIEAIGMSFIVFAGAAQLVALQLWTDHWTLGSLAAIASVTLAVNLRILLMGASLRPWAGKLPARSVYPTLLTLTDVNWALGVRYHGDGGRDFGLVLGSGLWLWLLWTVLTAPGYFMTSLIPDPRRYGLDLMLIIVFAAIAVPTLRRTTVRSPFIAAGVTALVWSLLFDGFWFISMGALAGAVTAMLRDDTPA